MGNIGGGEILVILLVALIVLGPTKLPIALRQVGRFVGEMRRIGAGFQQELREATEPLREPIRDAKATLQAADKQLRAATKPLKETAATVKAADPRNVITSGSKGESKPGESKPGESKPGESKPAGGDAGDRSGDAGAGGGADTDSRTDGTS